MFINVLVSIVVIAFVVLVGYVVWALKNFCRTLQRVDEATINIERELTPLLATLRESSERIRITVEHVQKGVCRAETLLEAIGEVGDSLHTVNDFLRNRTSQYLNQGMALWSGFQAFRNYFKRAREVKGE